MKRYNTNDNTEHIKELFIIVTFTIYSFGAMGSFFMYKWSNWIPLVLGLTVIVDWVVYLTKKYEQNIREAIYVIMVEACITTYGCFVEDTTLLSVIFVAAAVITGLLGEIKLLYITDAALIIIAIDYGITHFGQVTATPISTYQTFLQIANLTVIQFVIHFWVGQKTKNDAKTTEIIKDLQEAQRSKDDFLANFSHEIRTPINTICGLSEVALEESDAQKMKSDLRAIQMAGRNLTSLVGDILDFSELQSGKMELECETYNIASTINDVINMSMALKGKKPIELVVDCDANIPCALYGDEKKIRRVIMNFMNNALKFTNEGSVSLSVTSRKESYGVNLCVTVRDTGIGMKEEDLEKLFTSFNQVDTTRSRQEGGIGLGMALSQAIVQKMGGVITVKSVYGKGTTIKFVIPQKVVEAQPIVSIKEREKINAAVYLNVEQFEMTQMRDDYVGAIMHMIEQLQVRCQMCPNLSSLKRREVTESFTHVFISLTEYREDTEYFEELSQRVKLVVVLDSFDRDLITNRNIILLSKPLYILPIATVVNGEHDQAGELPGKNFRFTAPDTHVLVVDDNWMNLKVIEGLLKRYQIKVSTANNGPEALEMINRKEYDFVFMDHMVPEMDGVETLHRIRNKAGNYFKRIPIIAVTANAIAGSREMFMKEGFSDFIEKPIEISVLERLLRRTIAEDRLVLIQEDEGKNADKENILEEPSSVTATNEQAFCIGDLDVEKGMLYCGGKEDYIEILHQHCRNGMSNIHKIEALYQNADWKNYVIEVHAVKSMMLGIGAVALSEQAKNLEFAGKAENIAYIQEHHKEMLTEYQRVLGEIAQALEVELVPEEPSAAEEVKEDSPVDVEKIKQYLEELEESVFDFDEEKMLTLLDAIKGCGAENAGLVKAVDIARNKVEKADYMSASETMVKWVAQQEKKGGNAS